MEVFISQIEWVPVLVSTIIAFMLGWLWYSPVLFMKSWLKGLPEPVKWQAPMWMPMSAQFGATLFYAIIVNRLQSAGDFVFVVFITLTFMGFIKANGMYAGKTKTSISIEVLYFPAMLLVMILTNLLI